MTPRTLFWPLALSHSRISSQSHRHLPRNHSPTFPPSFTVAHSTSRSPLPHPSPHSHSTLHTSLSFLIYSFQILWKFLTVKVKLGAFMSMTLNALINHNGLFGFLSFFFSPHPSQLVDWIGFPIHPNQPTSCVLSINIIILTPFSIIIRMFVTWNYLPLLKSHECCSEYPVFQKAWMSYHNNFRYNKLFIHGYWSLQVGQENWNVGPKWGLDMHVVKS